MKCYLFKLRVIGISWKHFQQRFRCLNEETAHTEQIERINDCSVRKENSLPPTNYWEDFWCSKCNSVTTQTKTIVLISYTVVFLIQFKVGWFLIGNPLKQFFENI